MCLRTARYPAVLHIFLSPNTKVKVMRTIQFQYFNISNLLNIIVMLMHIFTKTKQQHNTTQLNSTQLNSTGPLKQAQRRSRSGTRRMGSGDSFLSTISTSTSRVSAWRRRRRTRRRRRRRRTRKRGRTKTRRPTRSDRCWIWCTTRRRASTASWTRRQNCRFSPRRLV